MPLFQRTTTRDDVWTVIEMYAAGNSYRAIEKETGISVFTISNILNARPPYTVDSRSSPIFRTAWKRLWKERRDTPRLDTEEVTKAMELYVDMWWTQREIAKHFGISQRSIARALHLDDGYALYKDVIPQKLQKRVRKKLRGMKGGRCSSAKLTPDDVRDIRATIESGKYTTLDKLGADYGVSGSTISDIKRNLTWKDIK